MFPKLKMKFLPVVILLLACSPVESWQSRSFLAVPAPAPASATPLAAPAASPVYAVTAIIPVASPAASPSGAPAPAASPVFGAIFNLSAVTAPAPAPAAATVSTTLTVAAAAGSSVLQVASIVGFIVGDDVQIADAYNSEAVKIGGFGSIILQSPTQHSYTVGAVVSKIQASFGPAPAPAAALPPVPVVLKACDWVRDEEGIARPANCLKIPGDSLSRHTCTVAVGGFPIDGSCIPPPMQGCPPLPMTALSGSGLPLYVLTQPLVGHTFAQHGDAQLITCGQGTAAVDNNESPDSWGTAWFKGRSNITAVCNNGTWTHIEAFTTSLKPKDWACADLNQMRLISELGSNLSWTKQQLSIADSGGFQWVDEVAVRRKTLLHAWQQYAQNLTDDVANLTMPPSADLEKTLKGLSENAMMPRGEARSQATCETMTGYFDRTTPSLASRLYCQYFIEKHPLKRDPISGNITYKFRDGCYCNAELEGGCPFRADLKPSYADFGFDSLEQREVKSGLPGGDAPSAPAYGSLCWYWSNPTHPEWGFLRPPQR